MSPAQVHESGISATGRRNSQSRDERRPLELFRAGKDHGGRIRQELKAILPGRFDGRKDAAVFGFDLLVMLLVMAETIQYVLRASLTS